MKFKTALIILAVGVLVFCIYSVSACGYFLHEDSGTRVFYSADDRIQFIEDEVLKITRFPTSKEIEYNVYILQSTEPVRAYNG